MSKTKTLKSKHFKAYQRQTFQNEVLSDPNFVFHSLLILFPPKISTFGANPSQKKFLQLCKIRAENHFLSLLLICRGVFPADYRPIHYKFCHLLQRSSIKLERRRCGSPVRSPLLCCPSLWYHSLDIRNGFFSKRQMGGAVVLLASLWEGMAVWSLHWKGGLRLPIQLRSWLGESHRPLLTWSEALTENQKICGTFCCFVCLFVYFFDTISSWWWFLFRGN